METLLSFPCQLGLGVVLRHHSLSSYSLCTRIDYHMITTYCS